ncbi:hypothetical protein [Arthrobacter sp. ISL-28]|uniref:hypothetical protein n=1 Tax=Arthrobacter sp. ISL-28 TaxID=2819108 RepID=UPI001BE9F1D0|nr:hypothetical protein [Arthrobacter sp. ISL-28]MBT2522517.1 hypothetical protein [Arthrobacter sp. ISL-28]
MTRQNPGHGLTAVDVGTKTDGALGVGREQGHVCPDLDLKALLAVIFWSSRSGGELGFQHGRRVARVLDDLTEDGLLRIICWVQKKHRALPRDGAPVVDESLPVLDPAPLLNLTDHAG